MVSAFPTGDHPRVTDVFRFLFIRPDIPPIAEWAPILEESYRAG